MKSNFSFLKENKEYELFADACIDAENVASSAPALSVSGSRKALELAVKWLYAADEFLQLPSGRYTLQDLLHDSAFQDEVDAEIRSHMQYIVRMGNYGIHTGNKYTKGDAVLSLSILFDFVEWIDYCYGADYEERKFDETLIPQSTDDVNQSLSRLEEEIEKQKQSASVLIDQKDKEIQKLLEKIEEQRQELSKSKAQNQKTRNYSSQDMSEFETRKRFIDADLRMFGWEFSQNRKRKCVETELEVHGMPKPESSDGKGTGYVDYVLYGANGDIIALIEAKRTSFDARKGTHQAELYAECIKAATGKKPLIFNTNGFETYLWDKESGPQRQVSGLFSEEDIQHLINLREMRKPLSEIKINEAITDRYYQKAAIRAVCENVEKGLRRSLLVMATGTGKTRVAASLTDVLSRGGYVTNVLFLADRKALVRQAKAAFMEYLGSTNYTYCNLVENKDDKNARMVFSTYPTMLNAINEEKKKDGKKLFSEAHFDLVIIDEAHRSIYNKYAALFEYFDAYIVGLTATPKNMDAASTYSFFKCPPKLPTYAYEYETARDVDHYLVPYYNIEVSTQIMQEGVHYDDLSEDEQEAYENEFVDEDGNMLEYQPPQKINEKIMNKQTVDMVLDDIMTRGLRDASGNHIGKTIIFAQTTPHAKFIVDRFNDLYPQYGGEFCRYVTYKEDYSDNLIEKFKDPEGEPTIIVSIDMMDTGVDVPEVVNLVFFKQVKSKIKFTQMIGRGTRKCPNLFGDGRDKECFYIFDYLGNFEFFRQNKNGKESDVTDSVICMLCRNRASLIAHLQSADFMDDEYQEFRSALVDKVHGQIIELKDERIDVKRQRRYVEKYKNKDIFTCLSDLDLTEICKHIAPLVSEKGEDDDALVFDNLIYGIMLNQIRKGKGLKRYQTVIQKRGNILLEKKMTIPAVKSKADELKKIVQDEYWDKASIMELERMRKSIRDLMKFAKSEGEAIHYTEFEDTWTERTEGVEFDNSEDFEDYEKKVNSYLTTHADTLPIYKLRHNQPLTAGDYEMLSKIFTEELGTQEDYDRTFQDTPLGKLVRRIVKMDHDATMQLFSEYIDEHKWNSQQIAFVRNLIAYVEEHGYIDDMSILLKPPFDRPMPFVRLYSPEDQKRIISIVNDINENATRLVG